MCGGIVKKTDPGGVLMSSGGPDLFKDWVESGYSKYLI
jgi:hypothetical protein